MNNSAESPNQQQFLPMAGTTGRALPLKEQANTQSESNAAQASTAGNNDAGNSASDPYADTFYGQVGGHETFAKIIKVFYEGVAADPVLRALYPEEDLGPAEHRMLMFIEQYWGGPRTYLEERGHPRLRMRHIPFAVTPEAKDHWLAAMRKGVDAVELSPLHEATLWDYLERAAASLVNAPSSGPV